MKLRNKKTGEIVIFGEGIVDLNQIGCKNVVEMIEAGWEDYEEPKLFYVVDLDGEILPSNFEDKTIEKSKELGNYFETEEEAEKAVEKLKAWKRLKDKGFRFDHIHSIDGVSIKHKDLDQYAIIAYADEDGCDRESLDLLFGGEE